MKRPSLRINTLAMVAMLVAAAVGYALTPRTFLADISEPLVIKNSVPKQFGDWVELPDVQSQIVDPGTAKLLKEIYTETFARSFVNAQGYRIMLSVAYGRDQRDGFQLHRPEVCYPAQGFTLLNKSPTSISMPGRTIAATRIDTKLSTRREPVTYWTVVGTKVFRGGIDKKLTEMSYGLEGKIPDGMLFRVSSIDNDTERAYKIQNDFVSALIESMPPHIAPRFAGAQAF